MRPDDGGRERQGGIPDGLLVGLLAFLIGMTVLVWSATGLAALFSKGTWPTGVTFARTPMAMRHLIAQPHDITGAWPQSPPAEFSGYGLFWGLFIGQLMILVVLTIFVMGTLARWRAVRTRTRAKALAAPPSPEPHEVPIQRPEPQEVPSQRPEPQRQLQPTAILEQAAPAPVTATSLANGERVGGWEKSSWRRRKAANPQPPKPYGTQKAQPWWSRPTSRSGRTPRTPEPNWARSSSTTPPTSATPRPASTGPPQQAARTSRPR